MSRNVLTASLAVAILAAFATFPPAVLAQKKPPATDAINLNSSKSNIYRTRQIVKKGKKENAAGIAVSDPGSPGPKAGKATK